MYHSERIWFCFTKIHIKKGKNKFFIFGFVVVLYFIIEKIFKIMLNFEIRNKIKITSPFYSPRFTWGYYC